MPSLEELRELDEETFTEEVVKPLLEEMDYKGVRIVHGADEYGKDIIFYTLGPFDNKRWGGAQLKVEDVHGSMGKKGNYDIVARQLRTALKKPHPQMASKDKVSITEVYLITSQGFTKNAKEFLIEEFSDKPVFFIDGEMVLEKVKEYNVPVTEEEKIDKSLENAIEAEETPIVAEIAGEEYELSPVSEGEEVG